MGSCWKFRSCWEGKKLGWLWDPPSLSSWHCANPYSSDPFQEVPKPLNRPEGAFHSRSVGDLPPSSSFPPQWIASAIDLFKRSACCEILRYSCLQDQGRKGLGRSRKPASVPDKGLCGCYSLQQNFTTISLAFKINKVIKREIVLQHNGFLTRWMLWTLASEEEK